MSPARRCSLNLQSAPAPNRQLDEEQLLLNFAAPGHLRPPRSRDLVLKAAASDGLPQRTLTFVFDRLDFVYLPSRDVAADLKHYTDKVGAELVFAIEAFGTRVAMVRLSPDPPALLLAGHLQGDQPVLVHRVGDLERVVAELEDRNVEIGTRFEILHGPAVELVSPGPQRLALYELTRPDAPERLAHRRDF